MHIRTLLAALAAVLALITPAVRAQEPQLLNYQGRVAVGTVNFDGSGAFKFALVNAAGTTTYWSNDGTSTAGSQPTAAVPLTVTKGLYSVLLGDTSLANMTAIPASVWANPDVRLRVWFNDGTNGSQLLTPDQRLAPNGYLPRGAVSSAAIADGAVTSAKLASNLALGGTTTGTFSGSGAGIVMPILDALDATARLALTSNDVKQGSHVREVGRPQVTEITAAGSIYTPAVANQIKVVCFADVTKSLAGKAFYFADAATHDSGTGDYVIWFKVDANDGGIELPYSSNDLEVDISENNNATTVAAAIKAKIDATSGSIFTVALSTTNVTNDTITITNVFAGAALFDAADIDTGFDISTLVSGADAGHSLKAAATLYGAGSAARIVGVSNNGSGAVPVALSGLTHTLTAAEVAALMAPAIDAHPDFTATANGDIVTVTNVANEAVTNATESGEFTVATTQAGAHRGGTYELVDAAHIDSEDGWALIGGMGDASAPRRTYTYNDGWGGVVHEFYSGEVGGNLARGRVQFTRSAEFGHAGWRGLEMSINSKYNPVTNAREKDDPNRGMVLLGLESNYNGLSECDLTLNNERIFTVTCQESVPKNIRWDFYTPIYNTVRYGNTQNADSYPAYWLEDQRNGNCTLRIAAVGDEGLTVKASFNLTANSTGQFVIRDRLNGADRITVASSGNVGIGTNAPQQKLHVIGDILASGTITPNSDRNMKTAFEPVDAAAVLDKVARLPIQQWRFKAEPNEVKHIGPMAQDFRAAFGLGEIPTAIATVDADGVALAAIQGLNQKLAAKDAEIAALRKQLTELATDQAARNQRIEARLAAVERAAPARTVRTRSTAAR